MAKTTFDPNKPITVTLGPDMRFLWPYLFEKRPNDDGEEKYEVLVQIPRANKRMIDLVNDAIDAAIERGFSGDLSDKSTFKKGTKESALKLPLKDGADRADDEYGDLFEGYMYLTAKNGKRRPVVLDQNGQQILDPEEIYSGAIGAVSLTFYPYNNRSQGVGVMVNHVMKLEEGKRLSGGASVTPEEAFAEYLPKGDGERPARSRSRSRDNDAEGGRNRRATRNRDYGSDDPMFD